MKRLLTEQAEEAAKEKGYCPCFLTMYVLNDWKVSVIYRETSAMLNAGHWYYETIVWKRETGANCDWEIAGMFTTDPFEIARRILQEGFPFKEDEPCT